MNKKVTLSLLSATVFASMTASAFAAPTQGVYIGGSVDKFYKLDDLFNLTATAKKEFVNNLNAGNPNGDFTNLVFVDFDGKGAKISEIFAEGTLAKAKRDLTKADFEGSYIKVNPDGSTGDSYDPRNDAIDGAPGDLTVEAVSAISANTVTVKFKNALEQDPIATSFSVKDSNGNVYAVTNVAKAQVEGEYILTLGTSITGKGTLTVKASANDPGATKDFDFTLAGISLDVVADETTLTSDGADNTTITVKVLKNGTIDTNFKGTVKFTSLKGAKFAKEVVAFDKGIAKVTITSISSATAIQDTIIAAIADAEEKEAVGKTFTINLDYVPEGAGGELGEKVFVTYAESDRASDVWVQFNKPFNFETLYADWIANPSAITVNNNTVTDIVKVNDKSVKLVLTDKGKANALPDNSKIVVKTNYTGINGAFVESTKDFNLVDSQAPSAVAAEAPDYRTIVAQFTEPVTKESAENVANWVLNGKQLSANDIVPDGIKVGKAVTVNGAVVEYDRINHVDNRHYVTIKLNASGAKKLKAAGSQNLLQAYNITDYAGYTDITGQNKAATQEFRFVTPDAPSAPTATVTQESVEQYRITFSSPVTQLDGTDLDSSNFKFEVQNGKNADGSAKFVEIGLEDVVSDPTMAVVHKVSDTEYLIELEEDWTQKYQTKTTNRNYYTPDWNNVRITVIAADIKNELDVKMVQDVVDVKRMNLDSSNPFIVEAKQDYDANNSPLKSVFVKMSEPVQINLPGGTAEITPSEQQQAQGGVPVPTFEFVSEDETVTLEGKIAGFVDQGDTEFHVVPKDDTLLKPGKWKLYIRSISDDVGNTAGTAVAEIEIKGAVASKADPRIVWATVHDNVDLDPTDGTDKADADIVHIQFGTEMSLDALTSGVYTINGKAIPEGTSIVSVDKADYDVDGNGEYDFAGTLVTIKLPKDFLGNTNEEVVDTYFTSSTSNHVLNVVKSLKDDEGKDILQPREVVMNYRYNNVPIATNLTSHSLAYDNMTYDADGETIYGNVRVTGENITLKNAVITGNLIISDDVQEDFTMTNVTVQGNVIINGGDDTSVHLNGTVEKDIEVNKVGVHVDLTGATVNGKVKVNVTEVRVDGTGTYTVEYADGVEKADAIIAANKAIAAVPAVAQINADTLADAKAKAEAARAAVNAAIVEGAEDADFKGLSKLVAAEKKIKELQAGPVQTDAEKVAEAKTIIQGLNLTWNTDVETTVAAANTAIGNATLPAGVTAEAVEGTGANAGKVVVTITSGAESDSSIVIEAPAQTDAEKVAEAKTIIQGLNLTWNTDVETTVAAANTAIGNATLPAGVTAEAVEGTGANAGKVVVTITCGAESDSSIVIDSL